MVEMKNLLLELKHQGISDKILKIIKQVPREEFIPKKFKSQAYENIPLPIGHDVTISQPYTVAFMIQALNPKKTDKILEIGTGSGWNAALISKLCKKLYTTEIIPELYKKAKQKLKSYKNITVIQAKELGYKKAAPYDKIIQTAASPEIPLELLEQLKPKGILLAPVGPPYSQNMLRITKQKPLKIENLGNFIFVPLKKRLK